MNINPKCNRFCNRNFAFRNLIRVVLVAFMAITTVAPRDVLAGQHNQALYKKLEKQINALRELKKNKRLSAARKQQKINKAEELIGLLRLDLIRSGEMPKSIDAKAKQWRQGRAAKPEEPAPNYTSSEKKEVADLTKRISTNEDELSALTDKNSTVAGLLRKQIDRAKKRLKQLRITAQGRPAPPPPTIKPALPSIRVVEVEMGTALSAAMTGQIAKVVKNNVDWLAVKKQKPWKTGKWRNRFNDPAVFVSLRRYYYRQQHFLRATLLIKREKWSIEEAKDYNGQLSTISGRIKFIEEQIMIELGRLSPNSPIAKTMTRLYNEWRALVKKEAKIEKERNRLARKFYKLLKDNNIKIDEPIDPKSPVARELGRLQQLHKIQTDLLEKSIKAIGNIQNKRARALVGKEKEITGKAEAFLKLTKSKFKIHERLGKGQSSLLYKEFLSKKELNTFLKEAKKRPRVSLRQE